jgi:hypothetical protein
VGLGGAVASVHAYAQPIVQHPWAHMCSPSHLCELTTNGTSNGLGGVDIGEEALGVVLDLLDVEAKALVPASSRVGHVDKEPILGAKEAADAATLVVANVDGVVESEAGRSGFALDRLVDVRSGAGGRDVVTCDAGEGDVVADVVLLAVDAELVQAVGAFEAAGVGVVGVDNLVGESFDLVGGGELERTVLVD